MLTVLFDNQSKFNDEHNGTTELMYAVMYCDNSRVDELLLDNTLNVDARDNRGMTALMYAVKLSATKNTLPSIKKLLIAGADVNLANKYGNTALMEACWESNESIIQLLLENGGNLLIKNNRGKSALDLINERKQFEECNYHC